MINRFRYFYSGIFFLLGYGIDHKYISLHAEKHIGIESGSFYFIAIVSIIFFLIEDIYDIYIFSKKDKNRTKVYPWKKYICQIIQSLILLYVSYTALINNFANNIEEIICICILLLLCWWIESNVLSV